MARFVLHVGTDNAAFEDDPGPELARILRAVAVRVEEGSRDGLVMDTNGNRVGWYRTEGD